MASGTKLKRVFTVKIILWAIAFIMVTDNASAKLQSVRLHTYKHWNVDYIYSDAGDGWNTCSMSVFGKDLGLSLNIDGNANVGIQIYDSKADYSGWTNGSKFQLQIDKYKRWNVSAKGKGNSLFVDLNYANNKEVDELMREIRQGLRLYVYEYGRKKAFYRFSLRGSKAATIAMVEKCANLLKPFKVSAPKPEPKKPPVPGTANPVPANDNPVPGLPSAHYDLRLEDTSVGKVLYFRGKITRGFADEVMSHGKIDYLVIEESDGGLLDEALKAGAFLRSNGVATSVDGACASACIELYAGGVKRYHSGKARFGIHAMSVDGGEANLAETQIILSNRAKYFEAGGIDPKIVIESLGTPAEEVRWLSISQAKEYGLIKGPQGE